MGEEVLSIHPRSVDSAEEDDLLLAAWYKAGRCAGIPFPDPATCIKC